MLIPHKNELAHWSTSLHTNKRNKTLATPFAHLVLIKHVTGPQEHTVHVQVVAEEFDAGCIGEQGEHDQRFNDQLPVLGLGYVVEDVFDKQGELQLACCHLRRKSDSCNK